MPRGFMNQTCVGRGFSAPNGFRWIEGAINPRPTANESARQAVKADTHRERTHDGYRYAQPILHL